MRAYIPEAADLKPGDLLRILSIEPCRCFVSVDLVRVQGLQEENMKLKDALIQERATIMCRDIDGKCMQELSDRMQEAYRIEAREELRVEGWDL